MDALVTTPLAGERIVVGSCITMRVEGRDRHAACSGRMAVRVDAATGELTVTALLQDGSRYVFSGPPIDNLHPNVRAHRIDRVWRSASPDGPPALIAQLPGACVYVNQISGDILLRCDVADATGPFLVFAFSGRS